MRSFRHRHPTRLSFNRGHMQVRGTAEDITVIHQTPDGHVDAEWHVDAALARELRLKLPGAIGAHQAAANEVARATAAGRERRG